jgi:3-hydroxybutyryl-CoA dehydrogenase
MTTATTTSSEQIHRSAAEVHRVLVVGAGLMGHGIAQDFAAGGYAVQLYDRAQQGLDQALENIRNSLTLLQRVGQLTPEQANATLSRIRTGTQLDDLAASADLVVEAVAEDLALKQQIFRALDRASPPHAILASTTSALLPSALAAATRRPERVLVAHYFNPPALMPLVELVRGPETSDETVDTLRNVLVQLGKRPAVVQKEVPGFIGNRLQAALAREAMSLVERGVATPADVDTVIKYSFGRRLGAAGVFEIADLAGLDLYLSDAEPLLKVLESSSEVSSALRTKVARGDLGVKSGQGFYTWTPESAAALQTRIGQALVALSRVD